MTLGRQLGFWLGTLAGFLAFLWLFSGVLLPFVAGIALAYLLDPVADRLERIGVPRWAAAAGIVLGLVVALIVLLILVVPLLGAQTSALIERVPSLIARVQVMVAPYFDGQFGRLLGGDTKNLSGGVTAALTQGASWVSGVVQSLWNGGQAIVSIVSVLVISPVVAAYMLIDWDRMIARIDGWLPRRHRATVRGLAAEMNAAVSGFVRGQVSVSAAMGLFYGLGLALVGLEFGLLIGLMAGVLGIIPYLGFGTGLIVGLAVALVQFWPDWHGIALVGAVFAAGQALEGWVLTPNWVGRSVGLHPVWLLFALFAFGSLFGFVGMLVAVPAAASVGVLARFALEQYLASGLYADGDPEGIRHDPDVPHE
ncbi:AI-2E family transporter [Siculibacillus lacustris]|uniref:AI-2E family transporter n=1 Tax=Siculibacillus lacustris TaxID=1549641 RepID=A0A4Q9VMX8_9HYPH|nr:AI-2E family transporter [Siculibacillus lacustris]TBW36959.1 AI-2E family transporter [Siculibacillus lacustris]